MMDWDKKKGLGSRDESLESGPFFFAAFAKLLTQ